MKLSTPIKRPKGLLVRLTQGFGERPEVYARFNLQGHNGVDLTCGLFPEKAYGAQALAAHDGRVVRREFESPLATKGNGVWIESAPFLYDGVQHIIQTVYWHLKEVTTATEVKAGNMVGRLGNSGFVNPPVSESCPYCGTHLHFGLYPYWLKDGTWQLRYPDNGFGGAVDPMLWLGDLNPIGLEDSTFTETNGDRDANEHNLDPLSWVLAKLLEKVKALKK